MLTALQRLVRHAIYDVRDGFLIRPIGIALALGALGVLLPLAEERFAIIDAVSVHLPVLVPHDPTTAQGILGSIISAMMTVVAIVLSVLLVALTVASMQFSPRILTAFVEDRVNQGTIGIFLGTFLYCLFAYPAAHAAPPSRTPLVAVLGAMVLATACTVALVVFIHHIARSINVNFITERIATETERVIDAVMPSPRASRLEQSEHPVPKFEGAVLVAGRSGYIRYIEIESLLATAKRFGVAVRVERRVGHFVASGTPLLRVSRKKADEEKLRAELLQAFDLGPMRTMEQDVEFGLLQLVDIALKAISPAVNDPSTAINCIDQLTRLVVRIAGRESPRALFSDPPGVVRVVLPTMSFARILDVAFDQIVAYGKTDAAVSLRVLRAFEDIASVALGPDLAAVRSAAERAAATCLHELPSHAGTDLRARLARVLAQADLEGPGRTP